MTPSPVSPERRPVSKRDKQTVNVIHALLMDRFPKAFPKDYDQIRPLKTGIHADLVRHLPEIDTTLLRRTLANHTARDGYLLALIHHRGNHRYDLHGNAVGTVTPEERADAIRRLDASTQRGQATAERVRTHKAREEKRKRQREIEQKNREAKAARKADHERVQQEIAARKAALAAQGIVLETRGERKRRLIREAAERAARRARAAPAALQSRPETPHSQNPAPQTLNLRLTPNAEPPQVAVAFKKRRRIVPPTGEDPSLKS